MEISTISEVQAMLGNGEAGKGAIRPDFNKSIFVDFAGAKITSDAGFLTNKKIIQTHFIHCELPNLGQAIERGLKTKAKENIIGFTFEDHAVHLAVRVIDTMVRRTAYGRAACRQDGQYISGQSRLRNPIE